jgi:Fe-S-cluster-containing dehydrogenase component
LGSKRFFLRKQRWKKSGKQQMPKYEIKVDTANCTGCLRCQLGCSDLYTQAFNPAAARIRVEVNGADCTIVFTEDCTHCGACADNCYYDALKKKAKGE